LLLLLFELLVLPLFEVRLLLLLELLDLDLDRLFVGGTVRSNLTGCTFEGAVSFFVEGTVRSPQLPPFSVPLSFPPRPDVFV
jgi:hypothetical protein